MDKENKVIVTYKCGCDIQTLKLLMLTEKDYIKSYNNIVDLQNELCDEVSKRNVLLAKHILGDNPEIAIKPNELVVWLNTTNDTEKKLITIDCIRITPDDNDIVKFELVAEKEFYDINEFDYDIQIDINGILESCIKTLFNTLNDKK